MYDEEEEEMRERIRTDLEALTDRRGLRDPLAIAQKYRAFFQMITADRVKEIVIEEARAAGLPILSD